VSIIQTAADVRATALQGAAGDSAGHGSFDRWGSGLNSNPQAVQITTFDVADPGDDLTVDIVIDGVTVSVDTGTGNSATQIAVLLAAAINAEPLVRGKFEATSAVAVVTLTGQTPGEVITVTAGTSTSNVANTQTADTADAVPAGRAVVSLGYLAGTADLLVALAASALFSAQVLTVAPTFVSGAIITATVYEVRGAERHQLCSVSETSATNIDTTIDALVAGLNTALPANTVLVAANNASATSLIFTAEIAGLEFDVEMSANDAGASIPVFTKTLTTGPSPSTSLHRALAGISQRPIDEEAPVGSTDPEWGANAGVRFWQDASVWVESAETITAGGTVYVELAAGASAGKLYAAGSSTRVALARSVATWQRDGSVAADNLAALRLNLA
jgi:hypothetical protein